VSTRRDLKDARKDRRLVSVRRAKGWSRFDGYVVAVSRRWVAIESVEHSLPDGLRIVRIRDIRKLGKPSSNRRLTKTVLKHDGLWPPKAPDLLDLRDIRSILFTAGSLRPLIAVKCERRKPGAFQVGSVYRITRKRLHSGEVLPNGTWHKRYALNELADITMVVLRDPYVEKLHELTRPRD
jgi:hypothetical protein